MMFALLTIFGGVGTVALAVLLAIGIGPVAALLLIWMGGLAATIGLAVAVVSPEARSDDAPRSARKDSPRS